MRHPFHLPNALLTDLLAVAVRSFQEAYRRWVCSTLIPYFDYVDRNREPPANDTATLTTKSVQKRDTQEPLATSAAEAAVTASATATSLSSSALADSKMTIVDNSLETKKR